MNDYTKIVIDEIVKVGLEPACRRVWAVMGDFWDVWKTNYMTNPRLIEAIARDLADYWCYEETSFSVINSALLKKAQSEVRWDEVALAIIPHAIKEIESSHPV
jgi:hypothetical protein